MSLTFKQIVQKHHQDGKESKEKRQNPRSTQDSRIVNENVMIEYVHPNHHDHYGKAPERRKQITPLGA